MDKSGVDIFLQLVDADGNDVEGECLDKEFAGAIEIMEFKLDGDSVESRSSASEEGDETRPTSTGVGNGVSQAVKPKAKAKKKSGPLCTFEITKGVDKASSSLMLSYLEASTSEESVLQHQFKSATVTVRKSGGGQFKFLVLKFGTVSVINYNIDVKSEMPEESMKFKFTDIKMRYDPQKADGTVEVMREVKWDFHKAKLGGGS